MHSHFKKETLHVHLSLGEFTKPLSWVHTMNLKFSQTHPCVHTSLIQTQAKDFHSDYFKNGLFKICVEITPWDKTKYFDQVASMYNNKL